MRYLVTILIILFSFNVSAQANVSVFRFIEGIDYKLLPNKVNTITDDKIEVTEAFSYVCGHCYTIESLLDKWQQNLAEDVELVKLHVVFSPSMKHYARIFYTANALGITDKVSPSVFSAIHIERKRLKTEQNVAALFESAGVTNDKFNKTFRSFGVDKDVRLADSRTRAMKITGTPQMIVDGKYSVTVTRDRGHKGMLEVVDFLVAKVRAERG